MKMGIRDLDWGLGFRIGDWDLIWGFRLKFGIGLGIWIGDLDLVFGLEIRD